MWTAATRLSLHTLAARIGDLGLRFHIADTALLIVGTGNSKSRWSSGWDST